jgi:hypothetical protein
VNALANDKVADYINEHFVGTYMKVGTFQIINGQKVGGNVASYFCLPDGSVIHAVPGQVNGDRLLAEARWAHDARTYALTRSTIFFTGAVDMPKFRYLIHQAHVERFAHERNPDAPRIRPNGFVYGPLPPFFPKSLSTQAQAHWYLGTNPLAKIDTVFPFVWEHILHEKLSGLPVVMR